MAVRLVEGEDHRFHSQPREILEGVIRVVSQDSHAEEKELKLGEIKVRGMNFGDRREMQSYIDFLNDPRNRLHFAHPPKDIKELKEGSKSPQNHFLVATRVEADERGKLVKKMVGGALLSDNKSPENDHWISLVVVDPKKQGEGIGEELLRGIISWSYNHKTYEGREREQLHLAINVGIEGWDRMERLIKRVGFKFFQTIGKEVDYWEVREEDKEPHLEPDQEIPVSFVKAFRQDGTCEVIKADDGEIIYETKLEKDGSEMIEFADKNLATEDIAALIRKIERSTVRVEKDYQPEEIHMPDGTIYKRVKKPTRRYLFRYVVDINKDHKSWEVTPENWEQFIGSDIWNQSTE